MTDPEKIALSGSDWHPAVRRTDDPDDQVAGQRFEITQSELIAADEYEPDGYVRLWEQLESGVRCWVYVDGAFAHEKAFSVSSFINTERE